MTVIPDLKTLYEIDDSLWLEETIELLKAKRFDALDLENLIEELEDLGNEKKFRVASFLQQIIRHALLLQFWRSEREYNRSQFGTRSPTIDRLMLSGLLRSHILATFTQMCDLNLRIVHSLSYLLKHFRYYIYTP